MLLLKIAKNSFFSQNALTPNYIKYSLHNIEILNFIKEESFSYYVRWLLLCVFTNLYNLKTKINYFVSYIYFSFFNSQKLISYIINISLSSTNTIINVNTIKGNPKFFYSAGMFKLQKAQKTRQPKAIITILRALLLKSKIFKTKPAALHFNNLFFNHQSYIFKRLKRKVFTKLITSYIYRPHNGCRLRKKRRIKIRTKTRKLKKK